MNNMNNITIRPHADPTKVILETICPWCKKTYSTVVSKNAWEKGKAAYEAGALMQNAFPVFTASQREMLMTGICDECWNNM